MPFKPLEQEEPTVAPTSGFKPLANQEAAAPEQGISEPVHPDAMVAPQVVAPAQPSAPHDLVRSNGVTQKAYGIKWDDTPSWWHMALGPIGIGLHDIARAKRGYVDPFIENEVQPRLAKAMDEPFQLDPRPEGSPPPLSMNQTIDAMGYGLGKVASAATGQTPEQGAAGGQALASYLSKSALSAFIGGAPFQGLDDATKLRALNELEDLNKHPVLAHWIRKSAAPMVVKLADQMISENADVVAAAQESLLKEAALLPLYLVGPSRLAVLEGEGIGLALARGASSGAQMGAVNSLATTSEIDEQGKRKEAPTDLDTAVVGGAVLGGALEGGIGAVKALQGKGGDIAKGVQEGASEFDPIPVKREELPFFQDAPVVIGLSSDALEAMAQAAHADAAAAQAAAMGEADAIIGMKGTRKYVEVDRTSTSFRPNMVTLNMEGELPVVRAVERDQQGAARGVTIPLSSPEAVAEVQGLSRRWGMSPIVLQEALWSGHPNAEPFIYRGTPRESSPIRVGTASASPRAKIRQAIAKNLSDVEIVPQAEKQPGFMIMTESIGGGPGAWQLHQINDPIKRAESLAEHRLTKVVMPSGEERYGFIAHIDEKTGKATVLAPAPEEGLPNSLLFDKEVPVKHLRKVPNDDLFKLGRAEPEALTAERMLYSKAAQVNSVPELLQSIQQKMDADPELRALMHAYTERAPSQVLKAPENGTGVTMRTENVSVNLDTKAALRARLAQEGINGQLADHLIPVLNKVDRNIKPSAMELRLLAEEWTAAQKAVQKGKFGTFQAPGDVPEPSFKGVGKDQFPPKTSSSQEMASVQHDELLASGHTPEATTPVSNVSKILDGSQYFPEGSLPRYREAEQHRFQQNIRMEMPTSGDDLDWSHVAPDDKVILADGSTGTMVALTEDTAVINVNGTLKAVSPESVVAQAPPDAMPSSPVDMAPPGGGVPPPPITGVPPAPIPPQNIPVNFVLTREFMSNWNKAHNYVVPAYSRGPMDIAQWALTQSSVKSLEQSMRADVYNRLNSMFGKRTAEFQEALTHYINGRTDLPAQEQLLNKFPEVSLQAMAYVDKLMTQIQINEQKLLGLKILDTSAADRLDPVHLTNSYLRWFNGPGEWAKIAVKNKALEDRVVQRILKEGDFAFGLSAKEKADLIKNNPQLAALKARETFNELIGLNDKQHSKGGANMGTASQSLMARNIELPPEYMEAMGYISDPAAQVAQTIARQEALISKGTMYRDVANSKWASPGDIQQPGVKNWGEWHLVEGAQFGELNGKWVHPQVWEGISSAHELPARTRTFANSILDTLKRNHTLYNPGAWVTNVMGNVQGSVMAGGIDPMLHPIDSAVRFVEALKLVAGNAARNDVTSITGRLLNRARALGMYAPGMAGAEMGMLRDFERSVTSAQVKLGKSFSIMDAMKLLADLPGNTANGISHRLGAVYDGVDQTFKMANWLALRGRGLKNPAKFLGPMFDVDLSRARIEELVEREAARRVATSFPMPHAPSMAAAKLRQMASGAVGAMNPFMTMQLEEARIHANIVARFRGQGGESGGEFTGRMIRHALAAANLAMFSMYLRRKNGISDEAVELAKGTMSQAAQAYKPGLVTMFWPGPNGTPTFVDATSGFSALRLMQGNSEEETLVNRVLYNALKTPFAGTPVEEWVDQTMRQGGFDAAPDGFKPVASPMQLRGAAGLVEAIVRTAGPTAFTSIPRELNRGGLWGVPPKDPSKALHPLEAVSNAFLGTKITHGGDTRMVPGSPMMNATFKEIEARKNEGKAYALPDGPQPGIQSLGMQNTKADVLKNAKEDREKAVKHNQKLRDLKSKVK